MLREEIFKDYIEKIDGLNTESARSQRFAALLQEILGEEPGFIDDYVSGIEKSIKNKNTDRILRGRVDNLFGNLIIEFEKSIPKKLDEAKEQLQRYTAILWSEESIDKRMPYICMATDGVRFRTYTPIPVDPKAKALNPEDVELQTIEEIDWAELGHQEVYFWLDRYFLRNEPIKPTTETISRDFGVKSHAFQTVGNALLSRWIDLKKEPSFYVVYETWQKYLRIVYGSDVAQDTLFIRHTYLATLAKLMAWIRITDSPVLPNSTDILSMMEGRLFVANGIENFIEEDFFSWIARDQTTDLAVNIIQKLFSILNKYDLKALSEDVLKSLYQELVDPETRHDLGEFYTPDWLAHMIVNRLLDEKPEGSTFDPACGSGTFLYLAIHEKRKRLGDSPETLQHIIDNVYGADVHPLAVIISKTNYILALGELMSGPRERVSIPVYLADTIKLPEVPEQLDIVAGGSHYRVQIDGEEILIPEKLVKDPTLYDHAIELAKEFADYNKGRKTTRENFSNYLNVRLFKESNDQSTVHSLYIIAEKLKNLIEKDRDTIWAFVLKNIYKPLFLKNKFDFIMGNPPWIIFSTMEPGYQKILKKFIIEEYKLLEGRGELVASMEFATLFIVRSADLYLKKGGTIAFVLPRSIFSADQHDSLRRQKYRFSENKDCNLILQEVWDCERITPLFNVPSSVLIGIKSDNLLLKKSINGQVLNGKFDNKNISLEIADSELEKENVELSVNIYGKRSFWAEGKGYENHKESYYKKQFLRGADIYPRIFWFVQVRKSPIGFNINTIPLETDNYTIKNAKEPYKNIQIKGNIENNFLYSTLLGSDLIPFGHLPFRDIVLPIIEMVGQYKLLKIDECREKGYYNLADWLEKVEDIWQKTRKSKAEVMTSLEWLDYRRKLTCQNPTSFFSVLYNTSGSNLAATIINRDAEIKTKNFIVDTKTYYYNNISFKEGFYLVSVLNSPVINMMIKPMQSRGLWGPRDIHKKVLELPIPQFDEGNGVHIALAKLGEECTEKVKVWLDSGGQGKVKSIGKLRGMVREMLKDELAQIDRYVKEILK